MVAMAHPYQGILLNIKKEPTINMCNNNLDLEGVMVNEKKIQS